MKTRIGIAALATMIAACGMISCSDTDEAPAESSGNAIKFGAVVPKSSRAASTTTTSINSFIVYGFTGGKLYMDGIKVSRTGASWHYTPLMYWPETPVNFFAYSPELTSAPSVDPDNLGSIPNYTNYGRTDLLYSVSMNETAKESPVLLNFRHALSRVDVMLSCSNPNIYVKVAHVVLKGVPLQGTFTFPMATTSPSQPENIGSWSALGTPADMLVFYAHAESDYVQLTSTPTNLTEGNLDVSFMVPTPLTELSFSAAGYAGSCIEVDCEIYDAKTDVKIWPNTATPPSQLVDQSECGRLMFPVTNTTLKEWKPGYAYVYNIRIDNPDVLHPIEFGVTVDDYNLDGSL